MRGRRRGRTVAAAGAVIAAVVTTTACGQDDTSDSANRLTWYINPDGGGTNPEGGGQAQLAKECTDASGGQYQISVQVLPNSASDQRQQLLRRLAAGDEGVDIMSVDPVFVAEFAEAGFLEKVPSDKVDTFTDDVVDPVITSAQWKDEMYASPFWANTQLLWYRKSAAKEAGLDMSKPVTWEQLVEVAEKDDTNIGVQASRYEGYMVWINALVEGAGGKVVENPGADGQELTFGLDTDQGRAAAEVIRSIAQKGVGGPALGSTDETSTLDMFQTEGADYMVNWPYVYAALEQAEVDWIDDIGWAKYPATVEGEDSRPPLGGIQMGVNSASTKKDKAWAAVECLTSERSQREYMIGTGNPAARKAVYDDAEVKKIFPMAGLIRSSLDDGAARPSTQYYGDVSGGIQREYSPPGAVDPSTTPAQTTRLLTDVLSGDALL
ncbi:extracellular solute-binding protein [Janibacter melonis]|uniref:extracellular solute-binding protein n=1 Tax=Janibacter melonis TaxID=262209 RepID=UPI0020948D45|nr:extracellular solute-binding protein [Janibacter melonis]